jgi:hypothetical protein
MVASTGFLGHSFNISSYEVVGKPSINTSWNQFDEHGLVSGLPRAIGETNASYKRRLHEVFTRRANSSYRGLVNGITRELGLELFRPILIGPKISASTGEFFAPDPYILFSGSHLYLYSDYHNGELEYQIDRFEPGGNYEHIQRLVDFINTSTYFTAETRDAAYLYTRSITIINQSNRLSIIEPVQYSTSWRLDHKRVVPYSVRFLFDKETFVRELSYKDLIANPGDYHINYTEGIISSYNIPNTEAAIRYEYTEFPWKPWASSVVLHNINDDNFKVKMFEQVLQDDGTYVHGIPTELGVEIINEILSVVPMYWGI